MTTDWKAMVAEASSQALYRLVCEGPWIRAAQDQSNPADAKRLLECLALQLRAGEQLSDGAREFLATALLEIVNDARNAPRALGLVRKRGAPKNASLVALHRDIVFVLEHMRDVSGVGPYRKASQRRNEKDDAFDVVADLFRHMRGVKIKGSTVKRVWEKREKSPK